MMPLRRSVAHLLLALALLFSQQALVAHPLTHGFGKTEAPDHPSTPAERVVCLLCVTGASASAALPSASQPLLVVPAQTFEQTPLRWEYCPPVTLAFSSRAPPAPL